MNVFNKNPDKKNLPMVTNGYISLQNQGMADTLPRLEEKPFYLKLIFLGMILLAGFLLISLLSVLILIPFYGTDVLHSLMNPEDPENTGLLKYLQIMNQVGLFIVPSLVFAWMYNRRTLGYLNLHRKPGMGILALSVLLIASMLPFLNFLVEWNEGIDLPDFRDGLEKWMRQSEEQAKKLTEIFLGTGSLSGFLVNFLMIAVLAALGEELFFRGILINLFLDLKSNRHLAVWISAILFSALHLQFYGFFPRMILGVIFGYLYVWTFNLWVPVILHLLFNGITVVVAYLYNIGSISTDPESFGSATNPFVIIFSLAISLFLFGVIRQRALTKKGDV